MRENPPNASERDTMGTMNTASRPATHTLYVTADTLPRDTAPLVYECEWNDGATPTDHIAAIHHFVALINGNDNAYVIDPSDIDRIDPRTFADPNIAVYAVAYPTTGIAS